MPGDEEKALKLVKQVSFYFSDSNFPNDQFLQKVAGENDGWIPVSTLMTFNRIKQITEDQTFFVNSLASPPAAFTDQIFYELDEEKVKLRRNQGLPNLEELKEIMEKRTLYVKGFPDHFTLDDVTPAFEKYSTRAIRLIKTKDAGFKGAVFVEFLDSETANKFIQENPNPFDFKGHKLEASPKTDKKSEKEDKKSKKDIKEKKKSERSIQRIAWCISQM